MTRPELLVLALLLLACTFSLAISAQTLTPEHERQLESKDGVRQCNVCPDMVVIPAGLFSIIGSPAREPGRDRSEGPQHVVTFTRQFAVGDLAVTVDQFAAFISETGYDAGALCWMIESGTAEESDGRSRRNPGYSQTGSYRASGLSWNDAKAYVAWLAAKAGKGYRLLSEVEWEYAKRVTTQPGSAPRFTFGDDEGAMCRHDNGVDQSAKRSLSFPKYKRFRACDDGDAYAASVGSFAPNGFGLHDMFGNVSEWMEVCWNDNYRGAPTRDSTWTSGDCSQRVLGGGA